MTKVNNINRVDLKFQELKLKNEKAMIAFITAGDPDLETTIELVHAMEEAGADIIELGIPYSDPLADGVVIQESSARALKNGAKIINIMTTVKAIREKSNVPLIYLVYYNSVFRYGIERFLLQCSEVGIDGIIIPDLPLEERGDILNIADKYGIYLIPLIAPTSKERIEQITKNGKGFIYCVTVSGVTGVRNEINKGVGEYMALVSKYSPMPKALGFGISSPEMAAEYKDYCDAIIVGSAIVRKIGEAKTKIEAIENVKSLVGDIKKAIG